MTRKVVELTLASAVATNATFSVGYPSGFTKADFALGHKHQMVALQSLYKAPKDFTVSLGTSSATVTWKGTTTLPVNTKIFFGFDLAGPDNYADTDWKQRRNPSFRESSLVLMNLGSPVAIDDDALIASASGSEVTSTTGGSSTFTFATQGGTSPLDGAIQNGVIDSPRNYTIDVTHASSVSAFTATVVGYHKNGDLQVETSTTTGSGTSKSLTGNKAFARISYVTFTENGGGAGLSGCTIKMGIGGKLGLDFPVLAANQIAGELHNNALQGAWRDPIVLPYRISENELGTGTAARIPVPVNGVVIGHQVALNVAASSGTGTLHVSVAGADTNGGGTTVAGLDIIVTTAATLGSVPTKAATEGDASQQVSAGNQIVVTPGAGFTTGAAIVGNITVRPTYTLRGTLVVADATTTPSGTSGDVCGTYTPAVTLDGATGIQLWVFAPDTQSRGTPQYQG